MGRNILFITTDQQRFDSLGCNGGTVARTPVVDGLAREGVNFTRAHCNNPVCMPARTTMFNGQHPLTHGVTCNGINYSSGEKGIARWLKRQAGYRTALIGKSHFEPMYDLFMKYRQNRLAFEGSNGPWLGFDYVELALHGLYGGSHYTKWLMENHPEYAKGFAMAIGGKGGGDTGAPEVSKNHIPRELYHTDWVADRTIDHLDRLDDSDNWFIWMSFPDPHHPFDPPAEEQHRIDWRDLDLPPRHPGSDEKIQQILAGRPQHWLDYYMGRFCNPEGAPSGFVPRNLTDDQIREINAVIHVENELIDEACGRVLKHIAAKGWMENTDVFFTTDHGDMQGDYSMIFKGPFHVDSLMRVPLVYRPAASANVAPAQIDEPVSQVDFVPTFCDIAGVPAPPWAQGRPLPLDSSQRRERSITSWDSQYRKIGMRLRTIYRDGYTLTAYLPSTRNEGGRFPLVETVWGSFGRIPHYKGTEGELYDHKNDPHQFHNLWDDPAYASIKSDLAADLFDNMPPSHTPPRKVVTPV